MSEKKPSTCDNSAKEDDEIVTRFASYNMEEHQNQKQPKTLKEIAADYWQNRGQEAATNTPSG